MLEFHRRTDGRAMLEIRDLGFEYAELSHGIRLSLVPGIIDAHKAGVIKISTLHDFTRCRSVQARQPKRVQVFLHERSRAGERLQATMKTIEMADQLEPS